jgi:pyruvate/2-oxoglutarate dehydrogenase complex dihydrolipoamide dehydrogenase (E3) component
MPTLLTPDICVIGAGSGGLSVAAAAAAFGVPVVLVEKGRMGGDCLNYGCVPSKALIAAARHAQTMREGEAFGIGAVEPEVAFGRVMRHVHEVIAAIAPNDSVERFTALGVRVVQAEARFVDDRTVAAGDFEIRARRFVVATGSSPAVPPIHGLDRVDFLTNETVFDLKRLPSRLVVIGGGPIGLELAQVYGRLGSQVSVVEAMTPLGREDAEASAVVIAALRAEGVAILEKTRVSSVERHGRSGVRVYVEGADGTTSIDGTHLLVAAGRRANVEGLGLERAGIAHDARGIKVDDGLRSTNRRVYAIGDAAGRLQFTHVAGYHAGLVARSLLFRLPVREKPGIIPWVTFTDPELAQVGLGEEEARRRHGTIRVLRWPYSENDRAQAERRVSGFVKLVTTLRGRLLGATIVGAGAGEMINLYALAVSRRMGVRDLAGMVSPYPTMAEIGKRASIAYFSEATRKPWVRGLVRFLQRFG